MHPESCVKGLNNVFIVNIALGALSYNPHMCVVSPEWRKGLPVITCANSRRTRACHELPVTHHPSLAFQKLEGRGFLEHLPRSLSIHFQHPPCLHSVSSPCLVSDCFLSGILESCVHRLHKAQTWNPFLRFRCHFSAPHPSLPLSHSLILPPLPPSPSLYSPSPPCMCRCIHMNIFMCTHMIAGMCVHACTLVQRPVTECLLQLLSSFS